ELRRGDAAAVGLDGANRLVDVGHRDRAFESNHLLSWDELATLLQRADAFPFAVRVDQIEAGWPPWLEAPSEHRLVELPGAGDLVCVDREEGDVIWHGLTLRENGGGVLR